MLALLPQLRGVLLSDSVVFQRIREWYAVSRQWLMGLLSGIQLDIDALKIGFLAIVALLLILIIIQAVSHRARRKKWLAMKPLIDGAVGSSTELILMVTTEGNIQYANPAAEAVFGLPGGKKPARPDTLMDSMARTADMKREDVGRLWETAVSRIQHKPKTYEFGEDFLLGGELYLGRVIPVVEKKRDTVRSLIVIFSLEDLRAKEETQPSAIDPATGLMNYAGFMEALTARMSPANTGAEPFCCSLLQVENLDMLTLEKGFALREELMGQLSQRITSTLREEWAVARVADDTFALASPLERTREECAAAVKKIFRLLSQHLIWESQYIAPLIRVGTAFSETAGTARDLLDHALASMAVPLEDTDVSPLPISPSAAEPEPEEAYVTPPPAEESPALETQTVMLYYQPQIYLKDGYLRGFHVSAVYETTPSGRLEGEALHSRISEKGLTIPFMKALLTKALKAARQWHALYAKRLIITCTLPPQWLGEQELPDIVKEALAESSLSAQFVEFFIPYTKQHPWSSGDRDAIGRLKELGVRLAASGLAGGALPLDAAVSPPFNTLVMTRSLLLQAGESEKYSSLISNIVLLGRKADKDILAMGIDGRSDLVLLREKECPYGQGMMIGGPASEEDLAQILIDGIELPL